MKKFLAAVCFVVLLPFGALAGTSITNFNSYEEQPLSVTGTSASGAFTTSAAKSATDVMIVNYGSNGAQVVFSSTAAPTAVVTASAGGTTQYYIPAGAVMVVTKGNAAYFAAITDSSTTSLIFHAGSGS